ncbi:XRE family transcriptional regulator [Mycobacteroides sp. H001]|uniref:helix-turn-helix domain-containing protein n=1 Tax=Mycobacteroides TaxID=670516 RepID=UPI000713A4FB|nr:MULTISPECIES: helix-turn-helix transcriptional regulator [Mycobacteroides]KRQ29537.1 XRE family transcriptional regulator [Mycobacteroides sp. H072]KRQ42885.1 XRE family transcriptional regulator [Mycobacteroides sp. H002]KRQ55651.1 XRE family transcriptional regulator [Mycobacteroides sp. H054]KRQ66260.1 XRE family transcriptional regulator [Mycobacteroides sp. H001]OHU32659.1 transcriptional regulator [Mycobacteroides chelonae]
MPTRPRENDPRRVEQWKRRRRSVGEAIRRVRTERGLTQESLAEKSGVDRTLLIAMEYGRRGLLYERLFDIADALDVPVVELLRDA